MSFIKLTDHYYRLKVPFESVYTSVFLITTENGNVLVDCATYPTDVTEHILPALDSFGVRRESVTHLFLTHSHGDHAGGLTTLLEHMPHITVLSFCKDICDKFQNSHLLTNSERILDHLVCYSLAGHANDAGGILDLRTDSLITGDAIQLWGIGKYGCGIGNAAAYRNTLAKLIQTPPKQLYLSHEYFPLSDSATSNEEVHNYLRTSEDAFTYFTKMTHKMKTEGETDPAKIANRINEHMQETMPNSPTLPAWTVNAILKDLDKTSC